MPTLRITVPGAPVPKGRPRHGKGRTWTPKRTRAYEATVAAHVRAAAHAADVSWLHEPAAALELVLTFVLPRPGHMLRRSAPLGRCPVVKRPDLDNYIKSTLDGIVLGGLLSDDAQVYHTSATKLYGRILGDASRAGDRPVEKPHTLIIITDNRAAAEMHNGPEQEQSNA